MDLFSGYFAALCANDAVILSSQTDCVSEEATPSETMKTSVPL